MTISTETSKVTYNGNGSTTEFAIPFAFMQGSDLEVVLRDPAGVESVLAPGADYSVDNPEDSVGGTLSTTQAPVASTVLAIRRDPAILQETHYEEGVPLSAKAREDALDLLTMVCQATREKVDRAVSFSVSSAVVGAHVPDPDPGKYLAWDEAGENLENRDLAAGLAALPLSVSQGGTGATTADEGLAGLGLSELGIDLVKSADAPAAREVLGAMADGSLDEQVSGLKNLLIAEAVRRAIGDSVDGREYLGNGWVDTLANDDEVNAADSTGYRHMTADSGYIQPSPASSAPTTDLSTATHEDVSGSITQLVVDTADTSGHFDAAAGAKVLAGCRLVIVGADYPITALTNDGDAADEVEFDGTLATGTYTVTAIHGSTHADAVLKLSEGIALETPDYSNTGGTGDRQASITVTGSSGLFMTGYSQGPFLVDGIESGGTIGYFTNSLAVSGRWIQFDFGSSKLVTEAYWIQTDQNHGTWKWQGSANGTDWTDIGSSFALSGANITMTSLSGNTTAYRYYRLLGVSGTTTNENVHECRFKIGNQTTAVPTGQPYTITLPGVAQSAVLDIDSIAVTNDDDSQTIRYAVSTDGGTTFQGSSDNGANWNSASCPADSGLTNWMTKTELEGVLDANWPALTGDLVLAVAVKSASASQNPEVSTVQWTIEGQTSNMVVEFEALIAEDPDNAKVVLVLDPVDEITLDTDLIAQVKRGTGEWVNVPLSIDSGYDTDKYLIAGDADLSAGSGTATVLRITSANNKDFKLYAVSNTFRTNE